MQLRDYQHRAINDLAIAFRGGAHAVILMAPTGSGKTAISIEIIRRALAKGKRVMFMVDKLDLLDQTSAVLDHHGIAHGVIQGDHWRVEPHQPVQVASTQTIARREHKPDVDLVIIDEAHTLFQAQIDLIQAWNRIPFIGLSATPFTQGLGKFYDSLIVVETAQGLIDLGYLCDFVAYGPPPPNLNGVKTIGDDYNQGQLAERVNTRTVIGDVVRTWLARGEDRQTICFAINIAHSKAIVDEFMANGVKAAHIDAYTDREERRDIIARFKAGDLKLLSSVDVLTKGFDYPGASCLIMARPTKSLIVHIQQIGRILRAAEGKRNAIILDHGGNMERLGFPTDALPAVLCNGEKKDSDSESKEAKEKLPKPCPKCFFVRPAGVHECPQCGFAPEAAHHVVSTNDKLVKIERVPIGEKEDWYRQLLHFARTHGYQDGWAAHKYRDKFGVWPAKKTGMHPMETGEEVRNWITHTQIKRAKTPPPTSCPHCGSSSLSTHPGVGPHAAQLRCDRCNRHIRWLPKPERNAS